MSREIKSLFINYRGKLNEKLALSLRKLNAPCKIIMIMIKAKDTLHSLKPVVPKMLQNNVVYEINCCR